LSDSHPVYFLKFKKENNEIKLSPYFLFQTIKEKIESAWSIYIKLTLIKVEKKEQLIKSFSRYLPDYQIQLQM
jgi:hypothetical protein